MRLALPLVLVLTAGCSGGAPRSPAGKPPPAPAPAPSAAAAEGIRGKVVKLVGDFTMDPPTGQRVPEVVPVHVFKGRVQPFEKPDPKHPALVRILTPDKDGRFEIALPPGEYTLVLDLKDRLYLNNWMDDGSWAIVVVNKGAWTAYTIEDVLEATF